MVTHPLWLTSSTWILLVLIMLIFVVHFCFEHHFGPRNFSNGCKKKSLVGDSLPNPSVDSSYKLSTNIPSFGWLSLSINLWIVHYPFKLNLLCSSHNKLYQNFEVNFKSWSNIITFGTPCVLATSWIKM